MQTQDKPGAGEPGAQAHTPGPWIAQKGRGETYDILTQDKRFQIATLYETQVLLNEPDHLEHDASLIAAAPEMFAACKSALDELQGMGAIDGIGDPIEPDETVLDNLRAAIARAEAKP